MDDFIVVDCQYDFIDGTMACKGGHEAVSGCIQFMETHDVRVCYTADWHTRSNKSFADNGGIWPVHCVEGTKGASLDDAFYSVKKKESRPGPHTIFRKGQNDDIEEYSGFYGYTDDGKRLCDLVSDHVYVGGIATEYCVKETVRALLKGGHTVTLLLDGIAGVNEEDAKAALQEMKDWGIQFLSEKDR